MLAIALQVYRSVLIERSVSPEPIPSRPTLRSSGTIRVPTPSPPARTPEVRDDLIQFYNKVYVPVMKTFVTKFNPGSSQVSQLLSNLTLSAIPVGFKIFTTINTERK